MSTMEMESRTTDKRIDDLNARMSEGFRASTGRSTASTSVWPKASSGWMGTLQD